MKKNTVSSNEQTPPTKAKLRSENSVGFLRILGAILLIVGTSIGGGMLALPIATAHAGFIPSTSFLFLIWLLMSLGAFFVLEVNLWLPPGSNLISMARYLLGSKGRILAWITYLLLLYTLLSAYLSGGADLLQGLFALAKINLNIHIALFLFLILFGGVVGLGVRSVDHVNRFVMFAKIFAFLLIVAVTVPLMHTTHLSTGAIKPLYTTLTTIITAYGFAIIVPSLRTYLKNDAKKLRLALLIGCCIPLICYVLWEAIIFGVLPVEGNYGLTNLSQASHPVSTLMLSLAHITSYSHVILAAKLFTSVCIITAFLGVALCMTDFLADGLNKEKKGGHAWLIYAISFLPPLAIVLFMPNLFIYGIRVAGIFCIILLMLMPAYMAYTGLTKKSHRLHYSWIGNKSILIGYLIVSVALLLWGISLL